MTVSGPSGWQESGDGWGREERETVSRAADRRTDKPSAGPRAGRGYLVGNSSRALLPQPQRRGHVLQHLKHVTVTDAPTGGGARGHGREGSTEGCAGGRGEADKRKDPVNRIGVDAQSPAVDEGSLLHVGLSVPLPEHRARRVTPSWWPWGGRGLRRAALGCQLLTLHCRNRGQRRIRRSRSAVPGRPA